MTMKTLMTATLVAGFTLAGSAAQAACSIYADWDFQGEGGTVQNNDYLRFAAKGSPEDKHLPARQNPTYWDPSWYNKISSVEVSEGCIAVFYMTPNNKLTGHQVIRETTARFSEDMNDKTHGMVCECK